MNSENKEQFRKFCNWIHNNPKVHTYEAWEKVFLLLSLTGSAVGWIFPPEVNSVLHFLHQVLEVMSVILGVFVIFKYFLALRLMALVDAMQNYFEHTFVIQPNILHDLNNRLLTGVITPQFTIRYIDASDPEADLALLSDKMHEWRAGHDKYTKTARLALYRRIFSLNNHMAVLVFNNRGDLIGCVMMIPMNKYKSNEHYTSTTPLDQLKNKDIARTGTKVKLINIHCICLQSNSNFPSLKYYIQSVIYHQIEKFMINDQDLIIYSEVFTKLEKKILHRMGCFCDARKSSDGKHLHELHFCGYHGVNTNPKNLKAWIAFTKAVKEYKRLQAELLNVAN